MSTTVQHRPLLTVRQTANRLAVSEKTVRRLVDAGSLPAVRIGASIRVDADKLESWLSIEEDVRSAGDPSSAEPPRSAGVRLPARSGSPAGREERG